MTEAQEIKAAQQDINEFKVLYNRYFEKVLRFCYQRSKDYDMASDMTSKVFVKAMQNLGTYQNLNKPFSSWLFTISYNLFNDHYRKASRSRTVRYDDRMARTLLEREDESQQDLELLLGRVLNQLEPADLAIVEMKYFENRTHEEIAEILNVSSSNARVKLHRAMEKLRSLMTKSFKETEI